MLSAHTSPSGHEPSTLLVAAAAGLACGVLPGQDPGVAQLVQALRDGRTRAEAAGKLVMVGRPAVMAVANSIEKERPEDKDLPAEHAALWVLQQLGPAAVPAVPHLCWVLQMRRGKHTATDDHPRMQYALASIALYGGDAQKLSRALWRLPRIPAMTPGLMATHIAMQRSYRTRKPEKLGDELQRLGSGHVLVRLAAIERLGYAGDSARQALPVLNLLLKHENPRLACQDLALNQRLAVARTILRIALPASAATHTELFLLDEGDATQREAAATRLEKTIATDVPRPHRAVARAALTVAGKHEPTLLLDVPPRPRPARPPADQEIRALLDRLQQAGLEPGERERVVRSLVAMGARVVPCLVEVLWDTIDQDLDPEDDPRRYVLQAVRRMGRAAAEATHDLCPLLTQAPVHLAPDLLEVLAEIAPWSRDHFMFLGFSNGGGSASVMGTPLRGVAGPKIEDALHAASRRYHARGRVDPNGCMADLIAGSGPVPGRS